MVELRNVCKSFGDVRVLDGVNLRLEKGFVYTLMGGNGSGKSVVLKTMYDSLKLWEDAQKGKGVFESRKITALPISAMIQYSIVYMPQKKNVFEDFTKETLPVSEGK